MTTTDTRPQVDFLKYSHTVGLCTQEGRGFYYPADTGIGANGRLYVANRSLEGEYRGVRVTMCNLDSDFLDVFGSYGKEGGQFVWPAGVAVDKEGQVYISDENSNRISIFDVEGRFLSMWGVPGTTDGELDHPSGIAFDRDENLYVSDTGNHSVERFTKEGSFISRFGAEGSGDGQLNMPWGITVAPNGDVYVADWRNGRIQRFSPDGEFVAKYGSPGRGDGQFNGPASVAVDDEGYIYVADWGNERVQVLDPQGGFVMKLRGQATESEWAGEFLRTNLEEAAARAESDLEPDMEFFIDEPHEESSHIEKLFWAPVSVKLDGAGNLLVTESNRHRIQVYQRAY